ncbi:hypothetical protein K469DRAFT_596896, partial [Zopfia rhizophila CBS 207.26]
PGVRTFVDEYVKNYPTYVMKQVMLKILNRKGEVEVVTGHSSSTMLSTCGILYKMFKSHLLSCVNGPVATYETEKVVQDIKNDEQKITVTFSDLGIDSTSNTIKADLVIAAYGVHSAIRRSLFPDLKPEYVGYVIWRSAMPEATLLRGARKVLENSTLLFGCLKDYILTFHVLSENGSLISSERQFTWEWYQHIPNPTNLETILTDINGIKHSTAVPRDKMHPSISPRNYRAAAPSSNPHFTEILENTTKPLLPAVHDP